MTQAQYGPNHVVDPQTGFIENPSFLSAFDAARKTLFLQTLKSNGLGLYRTCKALGISHHTVNKHYQSDPAFKQAYDDSMKEYADELEAVSRENALNPRSVIERIFQLKALLPGKYADQRNAPPSTITINIDGKMIEMMKKRDEVLEAQVISGTLDLATGSTGLSDSKESTVPIMDPTVE